MKFDENSVANFGNTLEELKKETPEASSRNLTNRGIVFKYSKEIEDLLSEGYTRDQIFEALKKDGLTCSLGAFKKYLCDVQKDKKKTVSGNKTAQKVVRCQPEKPKKKAPEAKKESVQATEKKPTSSEFSDEDHRKL